MFDKLKQKLEAKIREMQQAQIARMDLSRFNDPMTEKVEWIPMKSGGANFKTNILKQKSPSQYAFQLSKGGILFTGLFGVIGTGVSIGGLIALLSGEVVALFFLFVGLIFTVASFFLYRTMGTPIYFDSSMGMIWKGKNQPKLAGNQQDKQRVIYFNEVHAIQIISERVRSKNGSYSSYEINLVLGDSSRFHLVDHGNYAQIQTDSEILSGILGKPIWDVS